uniref:PDZ domain-containing protein n=1 Tax=Romanomermis culicivorax TaxID=13658 RepID=A0A915KZH6_ROMCU
EKLGLGLCIECSKPDGPVDDVIVRVVEQAGPACPSRRCSASPSGETAAFIEIGDKILSLNGQPLKNMSKRECLDLFRRAPLSSTLMIGRRREEKVFDENKPWIKWKSLGSLELQSAYRKDENILQYANDRPTDALISERTLAEKTRVETDLVRVSLVYRKLRLICNEKPSTSSSDKNFAMINNNTQSCNFQSGQISASENQENAKICDDYPKLICKHSPTNSDDK